MYSSLTCSYLSLQSLVSMDVPWMTLVLTCVVQVFSSADAGRSLCNVSKLLLGLDKRVLVKPGITHLQSW